MNRRTLCITRIWGILLVTALLPASTARTQTATDPRQVLSALIQAFQMCGPPQAYYVLGAAAYQTVWAQTGGTGCYQQIQALGPVKSMTVLNSVPYPAGPIYTIRADHGTGSLFWQIGISTTTQKVEYLNVTSARPVPPPPPPRVTDETNRTTDKTESKNQDRKLDPDEICIIYSGMCPKK